MPKPKKPSKPTKKNAPPPAPTPPSEPRSRAESDRLALRLAVLEDVVRRAAQETRAFQTEVGTVKAAQTELARRVADVEKRVAAS